MKKNLFCILLAYFMPNLIILAQKDLKTLRNSCFWFNMKIETEINKNSKTPIYTIVKVSPEIRSGYDVSFVEAFEKDVKNGLFTMGPFNEKTKAEFSRQYFQRLRILTADELAFELLNFKPDDLKEVFYYTSKIRNVHRQSKLIYERSPARVAKASMKDFKEAAFECLEVLNLLCGPFSTQLEAEISKFYQRLYGEENSGSNGLRNSKRALNKMANNFSTLKPTDLSIKYDNAKEDSVFSFSLLIPPKYFDKHSILVLSPKLELENGTILSLPEQTLQGEKVEDNNPVIDFAKGGSLSFYDSSRRYGNIQKLTIKGTFFNNEFFMAGKDIEVSFPFLGK